MPNGFFYSRWTGEVFAAVGHFPRRPDHWPAAGWATLGHLELLLLPGAPLGDGFHHLWDHLAGPADDDPIPDADVLAPDLVLVVEGGPGDGGSGDLHRLEDGYRGQSPGPSHLDHDVQDAGGGLLGGEFVGDGPPRRPGNLAEDFPLGKIVDLHHHPVRLIGELMAHGQKLPIEGLHFLQGLAQPPKGVHREAEFGEGGEELHLGADLDPLGSAHGVEEDFEGAGGGDVWVKLPEASGGGVAGVGEEGLASPLPLLVELAEGLLLHVHLAPGLQKFWHLPVQGEKAEGHLFDRAEVAGDVLPHPAIPAGRAHG